MGAATSKIKVPRGYTIRVNSRDLDYVQIQLFRGKNTQRIGFVNLLKLRPKVYETHSWLDSKYQNKGLGALMYAWAIAWGLKHKYLVRSSGSSSSQARRVWEGKTLRNFFFLKKRAGQIKELDTWYAYPKKR